MKPLIGITTAFDNEKERYFLGQAYVKSIESAGGIPLILGNLKGEDLDVLFHKCDGFLFSGGDDVDPVSFGEEPLPANGEINPERDLFELELARLILKSAKPLLAICRGIQVLNIAAGGTIYQDIYSQLADPIKHSQKAPRWHPTHRIDIRPGTKLAEILGREAIRVNSFHHQAVARVATGFVISAQAADGVIEGIESTKHPFALGLQCHPECLWERYPEFLKVFQAFTYEAQRRI